MVDYMIIKGSLLYSILYEWHDFASFLLFILGLILFVLTLEENSYRYQIQRMTWSIMALLFVFLIPSFGAYNLQLGFYWSAFPHLCVIVNDTCSYIVGFSIGKTPLIKISPKKTWEGFIGGFVCTIMMAIIVNIHCHSQLYRFRVTLFTQNRQYVLQKNCLFPYSRMSNARALTSYNHSYTHLLCLCFGPMPLKWCPFNYTPM